MDSHNVLIHIPHDCFTGIATLVWLPSVRKLSLNDMGKMVLLQTHIELQQSLNRMHISMGHCYYYLLKFAAFISFGKKPWHGYTGPHVVCPNKMLNKQ